MATATPTGLPIEVINTIMEIAVATLDPQSISSITLLSHHFRNIANKQRFSKLKFDTVTIWTLFQRLAILVEEAAGYPMRGIQTFITSIYIHIPDDYDPDKMQPHITVFNHLFRDDVILFSPIRKLSLYMTDVAGSFNMDPALDASLRSLLKESHINFLELYHSEEIPYDLLHGSRIEHLSLWDAGGLSKRYSVPMELDPINLKSLSMSLYPSTSFQIGDLLVLLGARKSNPFHHLTSLSISTSLITFTIELLQSTKYLETLTLDFAEETYKLIAHKLDSGQHFLDSQLFYHLKCIKIKYSLHARQHDPDVSLKAPLVGQSLPPHLEMLCITMRIHDTAHSTPDGPKYDLLDKDVVMKDALGWDETLSLPVCRSRNHLVVQMDVHIHCYFMETKHYSPIWKEHWRQKFVSAFSRCRASLPHFVLSINITSNASD